MHSVCADCPRQIQRAGYRKSDGPTSRSSVGAGPSYPASAAKGRRGERVSIAASTVGAPSAPAMASARAIGVSASSWPGEFGKATSIDANRAKRINRQVTCDCQLEPACQGRGVRDGAALCARILLNRKRVKRVRAIDRNGTAAHNDVITLIGEVRVADRCGRRENVCVCPRWSSKRRREHAQDSDAGSQLDVVLRFHE